ncbi:MAG: Gfo/Idh/MocA family oxidoreductase [Pirellulaceae bacterium]
MTENDSPPLSPAPDLPYKPRDPKRYRPRIALIGCGGIAGDHLKAYRQGGYDVAAVCDLDESAARKRQQEYYPQAEVYTDFRKLLARDDIEVVDIATHPTVRNPIVEAALRARKHVLSQKPFVLDLDDGLRLVELADKQGVQLAVNQNGRWAPHFSYAREAVAAGLLGDVFGVHLNVHWDHTWVATTPFAKVKHLILYDYAIHSFDIALCLLGDRPVRRVYASAVRTARQQIMPALLAQSVIEFDDAQASLVFDADTPFGPENRTFVAGTKGSIVSRGPHEKQQQLRLTTAGGAAEPKLEGRWFPDGFHGTMGELLCAIEEGRTSSINAADNLKSLAVCFAAVASAAMHQPIVPGEVRTLVD